MSKTRAPAGAARPSERVDAAVRVAMMDELYDVGYAATSMEAVARRAGVGKAALYRRWSSKRDMYMTALATAAADPEALPDTGSLYDDVLAYVHSLRGPLGARVLRFIPEIIAIGARDPEFWAELDRCVYRPRREMFREFFARAVERGELPDDADVDAAIDVLVGSVFWRYTVKQQEPTDESCERISRTIVRAAGGLAPGD